MCELLAILLWLVHNLDPGVRQTSLVSIRTDTVELFVRHLLWLAQEEPQINKTRGNI